MSAERDELLDLHGPLLADIREQDDYAVSAVTSISAYSEGVEHALDTVWAKGYRKPRTITTLRELNSLPALSVIRSQGQTLEKLSDGWYMACIESAYTPNKNWLPATVLHVGDIK